MHLLLVFAIALILPAALGVALAKHRYGTIEHDDWFKDPYALAIGFALVIATALFGALADHAVEFAGTWVRFLGAISALIAAVGFAVGRLVVKGED